MKLQVAIDDKKSKSAIAKEIEKLNKQKRQLYIDLKLRKDSLKKEFKALRKENNMSLNVDTTIAQRQIKNVSNTMGDTKNETIGLGLALKNAFSNAGYALSAHSALTYIRKAVNEATQAVKEYDQYVTNISVINGESRESNNKLLGDLAEKSLDFKIDVSTLESAAETLLRTGKSIDETNKYLENTIYLSKLGFQDMDTSASQLVTIGNAYGYTADEMSAVVDKFVKLDTSANITAGKLSEAVSKSAQNAQLAGFNIDQLAASIAGLKDTTGRTESEISNSLNMIFSRLQNVKLGKFILETEDGDTEDITQQINDMEKLLDTFGIKLRNSKNEFRDINELFSELSDNWSKFNSVQQSAIATTAAGARQRNTFIALIENWNKIEELTDVSLNSMGTAVEKYDNYLQSIEAKSATLSTSLKELWNDLLPADLIGNITDTSKEYERLNAQKKQKLKLDLEQQNTELKEKINEEGSAISSLTREYEALAKTNKEANSERLKQIEIELAAHSQNKAKLQDLIDKNNAAKIGLDAPTFEKSDNKDLWKEEAEKKFADLEHLYAMDKISYASYLNQMDKLNQHYYGNNEKYIDDFYKYEEKVYHGRKKLAEDLLAEEGKTQKAYHNNRISELEGKITVTTNDNVDDQGNKLNASEKFDYLRAIYDEIFTEIERRENEIVQSGVEGHEDELAQLAKKYEEYANKKADIFMDEIQYEMDYLSDLEKKYNDFMDKRIKRYEDERDAIKDRYDSEIKALDKTIDALKDKNDETKNVINLKKAEQDLEKSRQRTRMTYGSDGTIIYKQDDEAIAEAQQKVDDIKLNMVVNNLEKQKQVLEEQKDIEVKKFDDAINVLNEQKDTQEKYFQTLIEILNNYSNPKANENIKSVWDRIFADKENVKVNDTTVNVKGTEVSTSSAVFGEADSDKINQTLNKVDEASQKFKDTHDQIVNFYERYKRGEFGDIFDLSKSGIGTQYNPAQSVIDGINQNIKQITQSTNIKPTVSVGELSLNIQTPVGTIEDIAKHAATGVLERAERQLMMEIPNVFQKEMYSNLK